jgi:hypothetical protein
MLLMNEKVESLQQTREQKSAFYNQSHLVLKGIEQSKRGKWLKEYKETRENVTFFLLNKIASPKIT